MSKPSERTHRRSLLTGRLCQGLDLGIIAGTFCAFTPPFQRFLLAESHLQPAHWLQVTVCLGTVLLAVLLAAGWRALLSLSGIYRTASAWRGGWLVYMLRGLGALNMCSGLAAGAMAWLRVDHLWSRLAGYWLLSLLQLLAVRVALTLVSDPRRRPLRLRTRRNLLVIGTGVRALEVYRCVQSRRVAPCRMLGFVSAPSEPLIMVPEARVFGQISTLAELLRKLDVDEVILALPLEGLYEIAASVSEVCQTLRIPVRASAELLAETEIRRRPLTEPESGSTRRQNKYRKGEPAPGTIQRPFRVKDRQGAVLLGDSKLPIRLLTQ